jgi:O-antigen/teichoic acid export membrane protein
LDGDAEGPLSDAASKPLVSSLGSGFLSNLLGVGVLAATQVVFTPLFLRVVGVEGFAFIGFFITLQAILQVLDFGFAPTIARWLARFVAGQEDRETTRDFARTLEIASWLMAVTIGAILLAFVPVGRVWFAKAKVAPDALQRSLALMAFAVAAQWPAAFYQSGLLGLQRSVEMNLAKAVAAIASAGGAAMVLVFISPTVPGYFAVQTIVALLHAVVLRELFWRGIAAPSEPRGRFRPEVLRAARRFAAGMTGITVFAVVTTQVDRLIVSFFVSLEQFGYYALGWIVAGGMALVVAPAHNTLFPQFSALFAAGKAAELRLLYHRGARTLSILLLPVASVVALFSRPLLAAWTGNAAIAAHTSSIAALLVLGSALNGLMHPPYALQLASGSTRLPFALAVGLLLFIVPVVTILVSRYGVLGAAWAWPAMNTLYLVVGSLTTHRLLLPGAQREWILADIAPALAGALVPALLARAFVQLPSSRGGAVMAVGGILVCALVGSALASRAAQSLFGRSTIISRSTHDCP